MTNQKSDEKIDTVSRVGMRLLLAKKWVYDHEMDDQNFSDRHCDYCRIKPNRYLKGWEEKVKLEAKAIALHVIWARIDIT